MGYLGGKRRFIEGGTLDSLFELIDGLTNAQSNRIVQSHKGQWAQAAGRIIDVTKNPENVAISILLKDRRQLFMTFDRGSVDTIFLHKEDELTVQGQIATHLGGVTLTHCEIISHVTVSELALRELKASAIELREAIEAKAAIPASAPPSLPAPNKGGRPRKDFWEDLLIEMFDRLSYGQLTPRTQADIENAMADWVSAHDLEASERSIRERARKLWKVWTKEGNN